jgi:hypothetical protein
VDRVFRREPFHSSQKEVLPFLGGFLILLGVLVFVNPERTIFFPVCPLHALTGYYCPGCGSMRALHHLLHGDLAGALAFNPLLVIGLPFILYLFALELSSNSRGQGTLSLEGRDTPGFARGGARVLPPAFIWFIFGVLVLFTFLRNIPLYPFSWLAPG